MRLVIMELIILMPLVREHRMNQIMRGKEVNRAIERYLVEIPLCMQDILRRKETTMLLNIGKDLFSCRGCTKWIGHMYETQFQFILFFSSRQECMLIKKAATASKVHGRMVLLFSFGYYGCAVRSGKRLHGQLRTRSTVAARSSIITKFGLGLH